MTFVYNAAQHQYKGTANPITLTNESMQFGMKFELGNSKSTPCTNNFIS
jgi:hypothetical protein